MNWNRSRWKTLPNRNPDARIATLAHISPCAQTLIDIAEIRVKSELEQSDNKDIWDWYFNQRGGSCNGN